MSGFGSITRNPVDSASLCTMWDSGAVRISSASHPSSRHGRSSRPDSLPSQGLLRCYFAPSFSSRVRYRLHVCPCRALHNHANTLLLPDQRYLRSFGTKRLWRWYKDSWSIKLKMVPHLEECLMECLNKEAMTGLVCICTLPRHGVHRFSHRFRMVS